MSLYCRTWSWPFLTSSVRFFTSESYCDLSCWVAVSSCVFCCSSASICLRRSACCCSSDVFCDCRLWTCSWSVPRCFCSAEISWFLSASSFSYVPVLTQPHSANATTAACNLLPFISFSFKAMPPLARYNITPRGAKPEAPRFLRGVRSAEGEVSGRDRVRAVESTWHDAGTYEVSCGDRAPAVESTGHDAGTRDVSGAQRRERGADEDGTAVPDRDHRDGPGIRHGSGVTIAIHSPFEKAALID